MNKKIVVAAVAFLPSLAFAHPGHPGGFAEAFAHPFTGVDHLLMMLCVGIFAGRLGGGARWQLPLAFLSAMTCGWLLAANGIASMHIESGIAAGLIALGVLFVWSVPLSRLAQFAIIGLFAALHGMAHGAELTNSGASALGFLLSTTLLHGAGLLLASLIPSEKQTAYRTLGIALSALGGGLLLAA